MLSKLLNKILYVIKPTSMYTTTFFFCFHLITKLYTVSGNYSNKRDILHIQGINKVISLESHSEIFRESHIVEFLKEIVCKK